jgi:hypothetical protein
MFITVILALVLASPTPLTEQHQRDIFCVVEIAVLADGLKRGEPHDPALADEGKKWAGYVGARIVEQTGQPRAVVAVAMMEAAKARADQIMVNDKSSCISQMKAELAAADAAGAPLPKPVKAQ